MILDKVFNVSFRCYYENGNSTDHYQDLLLTDIPYWISCYKFTHPQCISVTFKIWFND